MDFNILHILMEFFFIYGHFFSLFLPPSSSLPINSGRFHYAPYPGTTS